MASIFLKPSKPLIRLIVFVLLGTWGSHSAGHIVEESTDATQTMASQAIVPTSWIASHSFSNSRLTEVRFLHAFYPGVISEEQKRIRRWRNKDVYPEEMEDYLEWKQKLWEEYLKFVREYLEMFGPLVAQKNQSRPPQGPVHWRELLSRPHPQNGDVNLAAGQSERASHKRVNEYIEEHLPEDLRENPTENKEHYRDPEHGNVLVIPIHGLIEAMGQFAHIGLGQIYGEPVIYIDAQYVGNKDVMAHELYEIKKWEAKRKELGLQPGQMRNWIKENIEEASWLAEKWHREAPEIEHLFIEATSRTSEEERRLLDQLYDNRKMDRMYRLTLLGNAQKEYSSENLHEWLARLELLSVEYLSADAVFQDILIQARDKGDKIYVLVRVFDGELVFVGVQVGAPQGGNPLNINEEFDQVPNMVGERLLKYLNDRGIAIAPAKPRAPYFLMHSWISDERDRLRFEQSLDSNPLIKNFLIYWLSHNQIVKISGQVRVSDRFGFGVYHSGAKRISRVFGQKVSNVGIFIHEYVHHLVYELLDDEKRKIVEDYFRREHPEFKELFIDGWNYERLENFQYVDEAIAYFVQAALTGDDTDIPVPTKVRFKDVDFLERIGILPVFIADAVRQRMRASEEIPTIDLEERDINLAAGHAVREVHEMGEALISVLNPFRAVIHYIVEVFLPTIMRQANSIKPQQLYVQGAA